MDVRLDYPRRFLASARSLPAAARTRVDANSTKIGAETSFTNLRLYEAQQPPLAYLLYSVPYAVFQSADLLTRAWVLRIAGSALLSPGHTARLFRFPPQSGERAAGRRHCRCYRRHAGIDDAGGPRRQRAACHSSGHRLYLRPVFDGAEEFALAIPADGQFPRLRAPHQILLPDPDPCRYHRVCRHLREIPAAAHRDSTADNLRSRRRHRRMVVWERHLCHRHSDRRPDLHLPARQTTDR